MSRLGAGFGPRSPLTDFELRRRCLILHQGGRCVAFPVGLLRDSSAAGYGRIWRLPVSFTIDRTGVLVDDGWKDKQPSWTQERLQRVVTPLLARPA